MSPVLFELLLRSIWETVLMTGASGLISLVFGLPLGLALVATDRGGIAENLWVNRALGAVINGFRSVPFIILLVALIPVTRLIVGTSIGTWAAIVPLSIAATPYYARIAEVSLREVDRGLIEAARAMGGNRWTIIREVLVPEALPGIVAGFTVTLVTLIGASAMAGAIGAGGLGDLAIRYGYQRFETSVMVAVVIVLIILVCGIQWAGRPAGRQAGPPRMTAGRKQAWYPFGRYLPAGGKMQAGVLPSALEFGSSRCLDRKGLRATVAVRRNAPHKEPEHAQNCPRARS